MNGQPHACYGLTESPPVEFWLDKAIRASETERDMRRRNQIVMAADWQALLQAHHLDSVEAVYALQTGTVLKPGATTELRRLECLDHDSRRELYVKKYWYPTPRDRWSGFHRGTFLGISKVQREFENLARLRSFGLDAPAPVAYGEERQAVVASVVSHQRRCSRTPFAGLVHSRLAADAALG